MDWSNEDYVRMYTRETDDDLALSWQALALWRAMLCRFDRSGLLATRRGNRGLAAMVRMPFEVVDPAIAELVSDGRVRAIASGYFAPNFVEAQGATKSDKQRQKESREKRASNARAMPDVTSRDGAVTIRDENVTTGHTPSHPVTLTSASSADPDPLLSEAPAPTRPNSLARGNSFEAESARHRAKGHLAEATWQRLSELRESHATKLRLSGVLPFPVVHPGNQPRGFRELLERIREEGERAHDVCDHVLRVLDDQARDTKSIEWLDEKAFLAGPWNKARSTPLSKRKPPAAAQPSDPLPVSTLTPEERIALANESRAQLYGSNARAGPEVGLSADSQSSSARKAT